MKRVYNRNLIQSIAISALFTGLSMFAARDAVASEPVVFQAADLSRCLEEPWKAVGKDKNGSSVTGRFLGFKGCGDAFGFHGNGTPVDPYRLALDGVNESVELDGLEATTRTDYTVHIWFRVRANRGGLMMLVDSRAAGFYDPLRMRIWDGKLQCSIEMPFPDRIYVAPASEPISTSKWYYAACRFHTESRELSVFLNGSLRGSTRIPPGTIRSKRIRIGGDPTVPGENFEGDIGEVVFSGKSEDADAIQARCKAESQRFAGAVCGK
jgi:Concanavalin A-like lectin/glucanases superfamily